MKAGLSLVELLVVLFLIAALVCCMGLADLLEVPFMLGFGWIFYLIEVVPKITVDWGTVFLNGILLVLFVVGLDWFLKWFAQEVQKNRLPETPVARPTFVWQMRWSVALTLGVVFSFVAGISMTGIFHQVAWLANDTEPMFSSSREAVSRIQDVQNLKQGAIGLHDYANSSTGNVLPAGATTNAGGQLLHSWQTQILPFMEQNSVYEEVDLSRPWNDSVNASAMKHVIPSFQRRAPTSRGDADVAPAEYGTTHYAGNVHLLGGTKPYPLHHIPDGSANTLLVGDIREQHPAWGYPRNWRDPGIGLNTSPQGFGSHFKSNLVQFSRADGGVAVLNSNIDPKVLRALATPAGNEEIPEEFKP